MGKYLILWEADETRIPVNPEERKVGWLAAIEMTRQEIKSGLTKEWGGFVGQPKGFSIAEGTEEEVYSSCLNYIPFFRFQVIPLSSLDQVEKMIKAIK